MDIGEKPKAEDIVPDSPMTPPANEVVATPANEVIPQNLLPQNPGANIPQQFNPVPGGLGLQNSLIKALLQQNARLPRTNTLMQGGPGMGGMGIQNALLNALINRGREL